MRSSDSVDHDLRGTRDTLYSDGEGQRVTLQDATLFLSAMQ